MLMEHDLEPKITCVGTREEFTQAIETGEFDIIISDYSLPGFDGLSALNLAAAKLPDVPFLFVSGTIGEERAVEALLNGATDYVLKDRPARLVRAIDRAVAGAEAAKKRAQDEARIRQQSELLDRAQDAICLLALDRTILFWNKSAERLYGWSASEAFGRKAEELLFDGDSARFVAAQAGLVRTGEWQGEFLQTTRDGKKITVESRCTLVRGAAGEPQSVLIINTDVTEKRLIEMQLLRTQRMDSVGALAGGIAHDLNNSLTPLVMGLNVIDAEVTSETGRRMLEIMHTSARRSSDMVKQILSFARGVGGEHAPLQIRHLIRDIVRLAEDTFPRNIEVQTHLAPELALVRGNATQINQILLNLCVNARDAMPDGGTLRIEAANLILDAATAQSKGLMGGMHVRLAVSDTGQGIAAAILDKIFEPFFTTKTQGKGTGLGLSTVLGIVKTHNGKIEVESVPGKGTLINVYLPAASGVMVSADESAVPEIPRGHGESVLLVDDEAAVLEVTRLLLEAYGYNVATAKNGEEAVALYREHRAGFNAVITDMMMPIVDGSATIDLIREIDPSIGIIGVSGLLPESPLMIAGKSKTQAFLKKPFTTTDLLGTLHQVLVSKIEAA